MTGTSERPGEVGIRAIEELARAVEVEDSRAANELLDERFFAMLMVSALAVRDLLRQLPPAFYREYPRHLMTKSLAETVGPVHVVDVNDIRRFAEWVKTSRDALPRDSVALKVGEMRASLAAGRYTEAADHARSAQRQLRNTRDASGFHDVAPPLLLRAGQAMLMVGDTGAAAHAFSEAHRWANAHGQHPIDVFVRDHLALSDAFDGNYKLASSWRVPREQRPTTVPGTVPHNFQVVGHLVDAVVTVEMCQPDPMEVSVAATALDRAETDMWWLGAHAHARHELLWGDPLAEVSRLEQRIRNQPALTDLSMYPGRLLHADLVSLHQMLGSTTAARLLLEKARSRGDAAIEQVTAQVRQHLLMSRFRQARGVLREVLKMNDRRPALRVLDLSATHLQYGEVSLHDVDRVAALIRVNGAHSAVQEAVPEVMSMLLSRLDIPLPPMNAYPFPVEGLTQRERDVLEALRDHSSAEDLAIVLAVSVNTVKTHKRALYRKLGVNNRMDALAVAAKRRMFG